MTAKPKVEMRLLLRGEDAFRVSAPEWANALALALKFGWNPPGPATSYLACGYRVSNENAAAIAEALDRAFEMAPEEPFYVYPPEMGTIYLLLEYMRGGEFVVSDE
jgi:hypothetical protein